MLNKKQCELLLTILNNTNFKGIDSAMEILDVADKLKKMIDAQEKKVGE